jgi:hypothetical protein
MHRDIRFPIALAIALFALPRAAAAQEHPPGHQGAQTCPAGQECPMHADDEAMQARHEAMMQQHQENAARIQELQDRMHAATGDAKVQAMEALLDEMLAQDRAMHEMMMGMHHPTGMDGMKHEEKEAEHPDD